MSTAIKLNLIYYKLIILLAKVHNDSAWVFHITKIISIYTQGRSNEFEFGVTVFEEHNIFAKRTFIFAKRTFFYG